MWASMKFLPEDIFSRYKIVWFSSVLKHSAINPRWKVIEGSLFTCYVVDYLHVRSEFPKIIVFLRALNLIRLCGSVLKLLLKLINNS